MKKQIAFLLAGLALFGCSEDPSGGSADRGFINIDAEVGDHGPIEAWDSGLDGQVHRTDLFVVDSGPPSACLDDDGALFEQRRSAALANAERIRADIDADGDGTVELTVFAADAQGARFIMLDASSMEEVARMELPGVEAASLMPRLWPPQAQITPIEVAGEPLFVVLTRHGDDQDLRGVLADGTTRWQVPLDQGVDEVTLMNTGAAGWRLLVNDAQGGCAVLSLSTDMPLAQLERCRLQPAWDLDGDGSVDILRRTPTAVAVLSPQGQPLIERDAPYYLGFMPVSAAPEAPTPGAFDVRGEGPELVGTLVDSGLQMLALNPNSLEAQSEALGLNGVFSKLRYFNSPQGLRIWVQEDRNGLLYLRALEPGLSLRPRGVMGPYRELSWGPGADVDGDGFPEVWLLGGSDPTGNNTAVRYLSAHNTEEVFVVAAERSARFDVAWAASRVGPASFDLDGCEGDERVAIRVGNGREGAATPTRLMVLRADGSAVFRGEPVETFTHQVAVADLDDDGRAEVIELIGKEQGSAQVVVLGVTPPEE